MSTEIAPGRKKSKITTFGRCIDTLRTSMRVAFYGQTTFLLPLGVPHVSRRDGNRIPLTRPTTSFPDCLDVSSCK